MELGADINFLAILVSGIAAMLIGALWYSPLLFGKVWMKAIGKTEEDLKKDFNPARIYGLAFLGELITAYVLSRLIDYTQAVTVIHGLRLAFLVWIGFTGATMIVNHVFERKSAAHYLVDSLYHLVVFLVMGVILVSWQ